MNNIWTIGRKSAKESEILLIGETVSAKHATLKFTDGKFYLIDNKSTNGSYIMRKKEKILLSAYTEILPSDIVYFGDVRLSISDLIDMTNVDNKEFVLEGKKIRCMVCLKPIDSSKSCPSCHSREHLKGK